MPAKKSMGIPFEQPVSSLASSLAEKGGPGIILLGIMVFIIWIPTSVFTYFLFGHLPTPDACKEAEWLCIASLLFFLIVLIFLAMLSYKLTKSILVSIIPTLRAEMETSSLMSQAFGGKILTASGRLSVEKLDRKTAENRIMRVLEVLIYRAADVLETQDRKSIRSNLFITCDNQWLCIADNFHVNMKGGTPNDEELGIRILNGYLSTGTAYKYFQTVVSIAHVNDNGNIVWPHTPQLKIAKEQGVTDEVFESAIKELKKANRDLRWIISMPVPFQVSPFRLAAGVLNLDGLYHVPFRDQLIKLLNDVANAAALIGQVNRTTDILQGQCHRADLATRDNIGGVSDPDLLSQFLIKPEDFDPAYCPEPSDEFRNALAKIKGLEFFSRISSTDVAQFLREQLRS